jgi:hypothetical protein
LSTRWTYLIEKEALKFKELEDVRTENTGQLFRNLLYTAAILAKTRRAKLRSEAGPESKDAVLPSSRRTPPMSSRAFSSEVDAGSRQENATRLRARAIDCSSQ